MPLFFSLWYHNHKIELGANAHMRPKQQHSMCIHSWKWMLKVVDLLASSQRGGRIIWKHYGSLWRTNNKLDIKSRALTMYSKAVFCRNGCAVPSQVLFLVCASLFPDWVLCSKHNSTCSLFYPLMLEVPLRCKELCFSWTSTWFLLRKPLERAFSPSIRPVQHWDEYLLDEATFKRCHSWMINQYNLFPFLFPTLSFFQLLLSCSLLK